MSKEMPIKVFAKKVGIDKKEQEWIEKNEKDTHYYNNSALKNSWLSLSYPIYDGDYYFAFIHDKVRVNAQYNAKANRELRTYVKSFLDEDEIFERMEKYFAMQFKNAGAGDTMTREELWTAIVDMRKKNPAPKRESYTPEDKYRLMAEDAQEIARKSAEMIRKTQAKQRILKLNVDIQKAKAALAKAREADSPQVDSLSDKYQQLRKRRDSLEDSLYD